jgi:hypothetical protein
MKKLILTTAVVLSMIATANAQKNSMLLGGNIDWSRYSNPVNDSVFSSSTFNPYLGYQFDEHFTAGIALNAGGTRSSSDSSQLQHKFPSFEVGPFVRYTKTLNNIFSVYAQINGMFGNKKEIIGLIEQPGSVYNTTSIYLTPAVMVNLKNNFALNFSFGRLGYYGKTPSGTSNATEGTSDFSFGRTMNIGVSKNFMTTKK